MISKNAIFIVGAGSSKEYGYPIWNELRVNIKEYLDLPDNSVNPFCIEAKKWLDEVTEEKTLDQVISEKNKAIRAPSDPSKVEAVIWTAIAKTFFDLEKIVFEENTSGWIDVYSESIASSILAAYTAEDSDSDTKILENLREHIQNVHFITFNYDRVLEYKITDFIIEKIKSDINNENFFGLRIEKGLDEIFLDKFYHPHGIINPYPKLKDNSVIEKNRNSSNLDYFGRVSAHILQFSPGLMASCFDCAMEAGSFLSLKSTSMAPEQVYILGNGTYGLKNNLKKLPCKEWGDSVTRVVCTSFNEADQQAYQEIINDAFERETDIKFYKTCTEFIESEIS